MKFTELRANRIFPFTGVSSANFCHAQSLEHPTENSQSAPGLNFRLLQFSGNRQLLALHLRAQIEAGWLEFWNALAPQVAHLHVESRV